MKVIYLEDDHSQAELLCTWLNEAQHKAMHCDSVDAFKETFKTSSPDIAILDWELPQGSGIDILQYLRRDVQSMIPILFTTQRDAEEDIVNALQKGADDYLIKPLRKREFSARMIALSRRAGIGGENERETVGPYSINVREETILLNGEATKLTQKDFAVALCLFQNQGKALSRDFLLKEVWGVNAELDTRTVDVHISRVRRALKINPENGFIIKNIFQFGYRLEKINDN